MSALSIKLWLYVISIVTLILVLLPDIIRIARLADKQEDE